MYGGCLDSTAAMKDVAICDKLRGGDKQPLIRRCPNGETLQETGTCHECDASIPREVKHLSTERKRNQYISFGF